MSGAIVSFAVVALAALVALAMLVRYAGRYADVPRRAFGLLAALVAAVVATLFALQYTAVYYVKPPASVATVAVLAAAALALFVLVGREVRWRTASVAATAGVALLGMALATFAMMAGLGQLLDPPFETRASQIAEGLGFTALMPEGEQLRDDYLPVDAGTGAGGDAELHMDYWDYTITECKADGPMTAEELEGLVGPGTQAEGGPRVPVDAEVSAHEVRGRPAVGVEYLLGADGEPVARSGKAGKVDRHVTLAFERDGVLVRITSWVPADRIAADGNDGADIGEMLAIAEKMERVELR